MFRFIYILAQLIKCEIINDNNSIIISLLLLSTTSGLRQITSNMSEAEMPLGCIITYLGIHEIKGK